jgi:hypothetical protein
MTYWVWATAVALAASVAFLGNSAAARADWKYDSKHSAAIVSDGDYHLNVHCIEGELVVAYHFPEDEADAEIRNSKQGYLIFTPDEDKSGKGSSFWFGSKILGGAGDYALGIGGGDAVSMAHKFAKAKANITVSVSIAKPGVSSPTYSLTQFVASGANDSIAKALKACK